MVDFTSNRPSSISSTVTSKVPPPSHRRRWSWCPSCPAHSQRRGGGFVDDAQHFKARDLAGVLGGLALGVVEVGGDRDNGLRHFLAQIAFGGFLHLLQDEGADLAGGNISRPGPEPRHRHCRRSRRNRGGSSCPWPDARHRRGGRSARLTAKMVFSAFVTACRLAGWPTSRSSSVKATIDGVVRAPSEFSITRGWLPSMMATHLLSFQGLIPMKLFHVLPKTLSLRRLTWTGPRQAPGPMVGRRGIRIAIPARPRGYIGRGTGPRNGRQWPKSEGLEHVAGGNPGLLVRGVRVWPGFLSPTISARCWRTCGRWLRPRRSTGLQTRMGPIRCR